MTEVEEELNQLACAYGAAVLARKFLWRDTVSLWKKPLEGVRILRVAIGLRSTIRELEQLYLDVLEANPDEAIFDEV